MWSLAADLESFGIMLSFFFFFSTASANFVVHTVSGLLNHNKHMQLFFWILVTLKIKFDIYLKKVENPSLYLNTNTEDNFQY